MDNFALTLLGWYRVLSDLALRILYTEMWNAISKSNSEIQTMEETIKGSIRLTLTIYEKYQS